MEFSITNDVKALGVRVLCAQIENLSNATPSDKFERFRDELLIHLATNITEDVLKNDETLKGFRVLHERVGRSNRRFPASPEALISLYLARKTFPRINPVVDLYNLVSIQSRLALGAHDVSRIEGDVILRLTTGTEKFLPLGSKEVEAVPPGEYGYIETSNEIICRMEHKQMERTKVTGNTTSCFFIVQGNLNTSPENIKSVFATLSDYLNRFCGGEVVRVWDETD